MQALRRSALAQRCTRIAGRLARLAESARRRPQWVPADDAVPPSCPVPARSVDECDRAGDAGRSARPRQEEHQRRCVKLRRVSFPALEGDRSPSLGQAHRACDIACHPRLRVTGFCVVRPYCWMRLPPFQVAWRCVPNP